MERWILHKLNVAATEINQHLADRNFMLATTAVHNFWLYELCDVFIVIISEFHFPTISPLSLVISAESNSTNEFYGFTSMIIGSDETNDRRIGVPLDPQVCAKHALYVSRFGAADVASVYAVCNGGAVAEASEKAGGLDAVDHVGWVSCSCAFFLSFSLPSLSLF